MNKKHLLYLLILLSIVLTGTALLSHFGAIRKPSEPVLPPEEKQKPVSEKIDFKALKAQNPDIYAWLEIPEMGISYPVVQHPTDDTFYIRKGTDKKYLLCGTLFTEHSYNGRSFDDPATIIYGHNMDDGSMFGRLQEKLSDKEFFSKSPLIYIYLPGRELHYRIFAATPYDSRHILYHYNFSSPEAFDAFFNELASIRLIGANFNKKEVLKEGDKILILSTCLIGNSDERYIVCAVQRDN